MKKNISINIFGTIYAIDEDAYQLLDNYINGMKKYFGNKEGGEEIADDIEHRVAELLWEEKEKGMQAVNIETVRTIINKIGNAAEIDATGDVQSNANTDDATASEYSNQNSDDYKNMTFIERIRHSMKTRRLYRNGKDKVLGGVCSGLAEYFGGYEVTLWRLATLILFLIFIWADFAFFLLPGIYLALWVIVPEAKTHEDWLRMRGKEVNAENIKKQIMDEAEQGQNDTDCNRNCRGGGCLKLVFIVLLFFLLLPLIGVFFGLIVATVAMIMTGIGLISLPWNELGPDFITIFNTPGIKPLMWMMLISGIISIGLPIFAIIRRMWSRGKSMGRSAKVSMFIVWVLALATLLTSFIFAGTKIESEFDKIDEEGSTRNGITLSSERDWNRLDEQGWNIVKMSNVNPDITESRTGFGGMPPMAITIRRDQKNEPMMFTMNRVDYYEEGNYVVESLADVKGYGTKVTLSDDSDSTLTTLVLSTQGERLDTMSWEYGSKLPLFFSPDFGSWDSFAHKHGGDKWVYQVSKPFYHQGGNIIQTLSIDTLPVRRAKIRQIQIRKL